MLTQTNTIHFTGIKVDKENLPPLNANKLEKMLSGSSKMLGDNYDADIFTRDDAIILEIKDPQQPEKPLLTKILPLGSSAESLYQVVVESIIKVLSSQVSNIKDQFNSTNIQTGQICHDMKGLLASVIGLNRLIGKEDLSEKGRKFVEMNDKTANRVEKMAIELMELSRQNSANHTLIGQKPENIENESTKKTVRKTVPEKTNMNVNLMPHPPLGLIHNTIVMANEVAKAKNIAIKMDIGEKIPKVNLDPSQFTRILENLLSNAIKYSHRGSTITVKIYQEESNLNISVIDKGQGIKEDEMHKLFKPFSQTSTKPTEGESSTGLGLSIVKKLVELHNGSIEVESKYKEGSRFTVKLPVLRD